MRSRFAVIHSFRRWKLALLLGAFVGALVATGFGAYAAANGGNTINACAVKATRALRISSNGSCLPSEQAIQWNQTGPPGPPGNTDSTVRHFSQFIFTGHTVTAPVVSAQGERGKLSIFCGDDPSGSGGVGNISFATSNTSSTTEAITFVAPNIPRSSLQQLAEGGTATFPWDAPKYDNVSFEMMIEPAGFRSYRHERGPGTARHSRLRAAVQLRLQLLHLHGRLGGPSATDRHSLAGMTLCPRRRLDT